MKPTALVTSIPSRSLLRLNYANYLFTVLAGLLGPLGFAPFHMPGLTLISLAFLYSYLKDCTIKQGFFLGFIYGIGYFGFGISWVIISIHDYGQLNYFCATLVTLIFIMYLSLYPALVAYLFKFFELKERTILSLFLFCSLWCLGEYCRATLFSGFPWLLVGTTLIDTPIKYIAPILGIYGLTILGVFISSMLTLAVAQKSKKRSFYLVTVILILITPILLKNSSWTQIKEEQPISVGAVQANLSMRDKWDETLFWSLLKHYENAINKLLGKQLIILPESAIPLPAIYLEKYLNKLHTKALKAKSALLLGILQPADDTESSYYNSIMTLGHATGKKLKRHLVPFGEYIPKPFVAINEWLNLPKPNLLSGKKQPLIKVANHPIASLICYEISYPYLLLKQMPAAQWIISISDNGWFGRSLAGYQQLQMAQILSLLTQRYQIVVNNDGLSSIINNKGEIIESLPSFSSGLLQGTIYPAEGSTPWIIWHEYPALIFCTFFIFFIFFMQLHRRFQQ